MKIKLKEIPREGLEIKEILNTETIGFDVEDIKVVSPIEVTGEVQKVRDSVTARVAVAGKYETFCARCLEPVFQERKDNFDIQITLEPTADMVDLGEEIRQEMVISIPTVVLCNEDCRGLCPVCGANLNKEKCKCKK